MKKKKKPLCILVNNGKLSFIYSDDLVGLLEEGKPAITRASQVDPTKNSAWEANIIGGPVLGPFKTRAEALDAEVKYLEDKMFT